MSRPRRQGFTLVEIMIVVAVIALLTAIAIPAFLQYRKDAQDALYMAQLRVMRDAFKVYYIKHNAYPPDVWHGVQEKSDEEAVEYLGRYRESYGRVLSLFTAINRDLKVLTFDTARESLDEVADKLLLEFGFKKGSPAMSEELVHSRYRG